LHLFPIINRPPIEPNLTSSRQFIDYVLTNPRALIASVSILVHTSAKRIDRETHVHDPTV